MTRHKMQNAEVNSAGRPRGSLFFKLTLNADGSCAASEWRWALPAVVDSRLFAATKLCFENVGHLRRSTLTLSQACIVATNVRERN